MRILTFFISLIIASFGFSQEIGTEFRAYPAGQMFLLAGEIHIKSKSSILLDIGYNRAQRQDFGVHSNEEGGGFGGGLGYRYYFKEAQSGFFLGAENFVWKLDIDWTDRQLATSDGGFFILEGATEILVVQPALIGGYKYVTGSEKFYGELGLSFGREYNVRTVGAEVGQGGISMIFFGAGYKF